MAPSLNILSPFEGVASTKDEGSDTNSKKDTKTRRKPSKASSSDRASHGSRPESPGSRAGSVPLPQTSLSPMPNTKDKETSRLRDERSIDSKSENGSQKADKPSGRPLSSSSSGLPMDTPSIIDDGEIGQSDVGSHHSGTNFSCCDHNWPEPLSVGDQLNSQSDVLSDEGDDILPPDDNSENRIAHSDELSDGARSREVGDNDDYESEDRPPVAGTSKIVQFFQTLFLLVKEPAEKEEPVINSADDAVEVL